MGGSVVYCLSSRTGTLMAGFADVIIGMAGLSLMMLDSMDRQMLLDPLLTEEQVQGLHYDPVKETFQFLIELWLPSLSLVLLGILLIIAATLKNSCTVISSFVFSTIVIASFVIGLLCLSLSGAHWLGIMPFFVVTLFQCSCYVFIVDFSRCEWEQIASEECFPEREFVFNGEFYDLGRGQWGILVCDLGRRQWGILVCDLALVGVNGGFSYAILVRRANGKFYMTLVLA